MALGTDEESRVESSVRCSEEVERETSSLCLVNYRLAAGRELPFVEMTVKGVSE